MSPALSVAFFIAAPPCALLRRHVFDQRGEYLVAHERSEQPLKNRLAPTATEMKLSAGIAFSGTGTGRIVRLPAGADMADRNWELIRWTASRATLLELLAERER